MLLLALAASAAAQLVAVATVQQLEAALRDPGVGAILLGAPLALAPAAPLSRPLVQAQSGEALDLGAGGFDIRWARVTRGAHHGAPPPPPPALPQGANAALCT